MKKINSGVKLAVFLLTVILLASLSSCGTLLDAIIERSSDPVLYDNVEAKFKVEYPGKWIFVDKTVSKASFDSVIEKAFNATDTERFTAINTDLADSVVVIWYDFDNATNTFIPNTNVTVNDAAGFTQEYLQSPENLAGLQADLERFYTDSFDTFERIGEMTGKKMGNNYFAIFKYNYSSTISGASYECSGYQAITIANETLYTFTFTTPKGKLDEATYEKMMETLEFYTT